MAATGVGQLVRVRQVHSGMVVLSKGVTGSIMRHPSHPGTWLQVGVGQGGKVPGSATMDPTGMGNWHKPVCLSAVGAGGYGVAGG